MPDFREILRLAGVYSGHLLLPALESSWLPVGDTVEDLFLAGMQDGLEKRADRPAYSSVADTWARAVTNPGVAGALGGTTALLSTKETRGLVKDILARRKGVRAKVARRFSKWTNKRARRDPKVLAGLVALNTLLWGGGAAAGRMIHGRALRSRLDRGNRLLTPSEREILRRRR